MKRLNLIFILLILALHACGNNDGEPDTGGNGHHTKAPTLKGKLIYHNYSSYDANDSRMWLYDFATDHLQCISDSWNITNPMNAHFSPDGQQIVFMGIGSNNTWCIYLYDFRTGGQPVNLTPSASRDEDPKYSPDGKRIAFKRNSRVAEMVLESREVTMLTEDDCSMPYYNHDGTKMVASTGDGPTSAIVIIDIATKQMHTAYDIQGVQDYYPINADENSFYYSQGFSPTNRIDQVYRGYWNGLPGKKLPFNASDGDYSDAYPVNKEWVIISSTRTDTQGAYDLYIAHVETGDIFSMNDYNKGINTKNNELGACVREEK